MEKIALQTPSFRGDIYIGEGAAERLRGLAAGQKNFAVADSNVFALYPAFFERYFSDCKIFVLPAGEENKTFENLGRILSAMAEAGLHRTSRLFAVGGGVVGDIAGLAASLYMRGVNLVQIPTTLLAQVDSSVGGKTAVDFQGVKNIIGAFYQPSEVIVDPLFLRTLPRREIRCGLGEIIKYGALDKNIYASLCKNARSLFSEDFFEGITYDCIAHKAAVVCADERDTGGKRKTLNLGHTTGHAFELYYKRKSHGEFVLIGMYYEIFIAKRLERCENNYADSLISLIKRVIKNIPAYDDAGKAAEFAKYDKKNTQTSLISLIAPAREDESVEITLPAQEYCALIAECARKLKEKT